MTVLSPKKAYLAFLTQKRLRELRLTQHLFVDFWNSISHTDEIESEIQFFLDGQTKVGNILELPACPFLNETWNYFP